MARNEAFPDEPFAILDLAVRWYPGDALMAYPARKTYSAARREGARPRQEMAREHHCGNTLGDQAQCNGYVAKRYPIHSRSDRLGDATATSSYVGEAHS